MPDGGGRASEDQDTRVEFSIELVCRDRRTGEPHTYKARSEEGKHERRVGLGLQREGPAGWGGGDAAREVKAKDVFEETGEEESVKVDRQENPSRSKLGITYSETFTWSRLEFTGKLVLAIIRADHTTTKFFVNK